MVQMWCEGVEERRMTPRKTLEPLLVLPYLLELPGSGGSPHILLGHAISFSADRNQGGKAVKHLLLGAAGLGETFSLEFGAAGQS